MKIKNVIPRLNIDTPFAKLSLREYRYLTMHQGITLSRDVEQSHPVSLSEATQHLGQIISIQRVPMHR